MKQKLLSIILVVALGCLCSFGAQAANETYSVWNGTDATSWVAIPDEIEVTSAADLAGIAALSASQDFTGKTITLKANIDLDYKAWTPIGTATNPFNGTFKGSGYLIRGLRTFSGATDGVGLFGHVGQNAVIEQVGISGGKIMAKNKTRIGALAGVCAGTIRECWSMAQFVATGDTTGGLVGKLTADGSIIDCYQAGYLNNLSTAVGCIVGSNAGALVRVFNIGYASSEDGHAIVGEDKGGSYTQCYFDRKAYLQKSGIEGNVITPIDSTAHMFSLFAGNATWSNATTRYPILSAFAGKDAALLSAAPMYLETSNTAPVEHANDVTLAFNVSIVGGITWTCQKQADEQWISINNTDGSVQVVRPCAPTVVLVDAQLNNETRVVYMSPRRVEDLVPGIFVGRDEEADTLNYTHYYCFDSYEEFKEEAYMRPATEGWIGIGGDYHYEVIRYRITDTDTLLVDTMLADCGKGDYITWYDTCKVPTDVPGHYIVRSYVHDNGCMTDWLENKSGFEYYVFEEFVPGMIVTKRDTILLNTIPTLVKSEGSEASHGGGGTIYYQWFVNGDSIHTQTALELKDYPISKAGIYRFTRGTRDSVCYVPEHDVSKLGEYTVVAFDSLDPGEIIDHEKLSFCTVVDAEEHIIEATDATGGAGTIEYRWLRNGIAIPQATGRDLDLSNIGLQAGHDYVFTREVQDNTRFTTWTKTRYTLQIHIMSTLTPGDIEDEERSPYCFAENAKETESITVHIKETTEATCADGIEYQWRRTPGEEEIGDQANLNYTVHLNEISLGTIYTYTRYVRQAGSDCDWIKSDGEVTQYYGQASSVHITRSICREKMPYTFTHVDKEGKETSHTFTEDGETWSFTDKDSDCPIDSFITILVTDVPSFRIDTAAHVCQETGTMALEFERTAGMANTFRITFSPDMAFYMGRTDTVGTITTQGLILLTDMPPIGVGDCYLNLEIGYAVDGETEGICYSAPSKLQVTFSLGGYLHTKYDRVLFVDNNPDNGIETGGAEKLKFVAYQWYKDGQILEGETKQYYHQGGASLVGTFYVLLTAENGDQYRSCEVTLPTTSGSSAPEMSHIYPVPVDAGQPLTIECFGDVQIISFYGERVSDLRNVEGSATLSAPHMQGVYFVQITAADGTVETHKLIVK